MRAKEMMPNDWIIGGTFDGDKAQKISTVDMDKQHCLDEISLTASRCKQFIREMGNNPNNFT